MNGDISLQLNEEIKPIMGYESLYSITSYGRIWSHEKITKFGRSYKIYKSKILKLQLNKDGYSYIVLSSGNKKKFFKMHRLVATHYIPNPLNLPEVNHKDGIKTNCRKDNLEWCTHQGNSNHASVNKLRKYKFHSKLYGVTFSKGCSNKNKPWVSYTRINKIKIYIGYFKTEIEAAIMYNRFVIENNLNRPLNKI